ncbi:hypothetical protein [Photobacterium halotolerans]|uniref:Uncharacterized protein n=1 Tax=Photobacterium halotolerans TaxID=265726 RepID=A0A7X5AV43_9GAMM|nr:hypothetical protein [Photobacterium halotolerans]NAW67517.1 hypothetical protein [Photobacterium halotolerans]
MTITQGTHRLALLLAAVLVAGCGGDGKSGERGLNVDGDPLLASLQPYLSTSPYGLVAEDCAVIYKQGQSCQMQDIAPLGYDIQGDLTPDDIAQRLLVSHHWMGDSFMDVVRDLPQDVLNLFRPLNVIVLSFDIRPSFYHTDTAGIYIDPRYLWRNQAEWNDIYQQQDYRSGFAESLPFLAMQRYVYSNGSYVTYSNSFDVNNNYWRSKSEIAPGLFNLLVHELAHANDFLPPDQLSVLDVSTSIGKNIKLITGNWIQTSLQQAHALSAGSLQLMAESYFGGALASTSMSPEQAGSAFEPDGAADFYGYYTGAEDVAMLFEAYMMWREYGAVSDVAFVSSPAFANYSCDDLIIGWGQRNRLAQKEVVPRARLVSESLLQQDLSAEFAAIASSIPVDLPYGYGWCQARTAVMSARFERFSREAQVPVADHSQRYLDEMLRH